MNNYDLDPFQSDIMSETNDIKEEVQVFEQADELATETEDAIFRDCNLVDAQDRVYTKSSKHTLKEMTLIEITGSIPILSWIFFILYLRQGTSDDIKTLIKSKMIKRVLFYILYILFILYIIFIDSSWDPTI